VVARTFRVRTTRSRPARRSTSTWWATVLFGLPSAAASSVTEAARSSTRSKMAIRVRSPNAFSWCGWSARTASGRS
jgi:hypothetical protein